MAKKQKKKYWKKIRECDKEIEYLLGNYMINEEQKTLQPRLDYQVKKKRTIKMILM